MGFLIYLAIGAIMAMLFVKSDNVETALPELYKTYLSQTNDPEFTFESFSKWMYRGLLVAYCCFWPGIILRNLYLLIKRGGQGGGGSGSPQPVMA